MSKDWEKIAKEYENEIKNLWNDILTASGILEGSLCPRDLNKVQSILDNSVESSEKAVDEIKKFIA